MQRDNRGTIASLTPQIGLPRPSSTWDLQGSARTQVAGWSWQAESGRQEGYCASIIPLHPLIILLLSSYSFLIILSLIHI